MKTKNFENAELYENIVNELINLKCNLCEIREKIEHLTKQQVKEIESFYPDTLQHVLVAVNNAIKPLTIIHAPNDIFIYEKEVEKFKKNFEGWNWDGEWTSDGRYCTTWEGEVYVSLNHDGSIHVDAFANKGKDFGIGEYSKAKRYIEKEFRKNGY